MPSPSGATSHFGFPYLLESDIPDVATASQDLAQAVENALEVPLTANPAGRVYAVTGTLGMSIATAFTTVATDYLKGGMTASTHGLVVPVTGAYQVNTNSWFIMGGSSSQAQIYIFKTTSGTPSAVSIGDLADVASGGAFSLGCSDTVDLVAGDIVDVRVYSSLSNGTMANVNTPAYNFLSLHLASQ